MWSSAAARAEVVAPIIDIHHHIGPRGRLHGGEATPFDVVSHLAWHRACMDRHGVDQACLIASHSDIATLGGSAQRVNDIVAEAVGTDPHRFPIGIGTVDPVLGMGGLREIERCILSLGLRAMAWHAHFQGTFLDSPLARLYMERCAELDVPILVHVLADSKNEAIWRLFAVAEAMPAARFVALDAFTSFDQAEWIIRVGGRLSNVWYETGCLFDPGHLLHRFVARHGFSRLIFGSDFYPEWPGWFPSPLYQVLHADWSVEDKQAILGGNARDLFRM